MSFNNLKIIVYCMSLILFLIIGAMNPNQLILETQIPSEILPLLKKIAQQSGIGLNSLANAAYRRSNFGRVEKAKIINVVIPTEIQKFISISQFVSQNIFRLKDFNISNYIIFKQNTYLYGLMLLSQNEIVLGGNLNPFDYEQSLIMLAKTIKTIGSPLVPSGLPTCCTITLKFGEVYPNSIINQFPNISRFHTGIDISDSIDSETKVHSTMDGVASIGFNNCAGNYITISNSHFRTYYGHLAKIFVQNGQLIKDLQAIGLQGSSGYCSTGKHTHYEVYENGILKNPLDY